MNFENVIWNIAMFLLGVTVAIGLCKFCPGFWPWVAGGILS